MTGLPEFAHDVIVHEQHVLAAAEQDGDVPVSGGPGS